jgi:hypothetical protein
MESQQGMLDGLTREVDGRAPNSSEAEVLPPGPEE